jgi:PhnB protein
MTTVNPVPENARTLTPHITVKGAARAIEWYRTVLGAAEEFRMAMPGSDTIMHARLRIGDSHLMINDEFPQSGATAPAVGHSGWTIHVYTANVDDVYRRAIEAGATEEMAPMDTFWGDRYGKFTDPFGHHWSVASRIENLTPDQITQRAQEYFTQAKG